MLEEYAWYLTKEQALTIGTWIAEVWIGRYKSTYGTYVSDQWDCLLLLIRSKNRSM